MSAGGSEILALDITNPALPVLSTSFGQSGNALGAWGCSHRGTRVYGSYVKTLGIPFAGTAAGVIGFDTP